MARTLTPTTVGGEYDASAVLIDAVVALFRWTSGACGLIACLHGPFNLSMGAFGIDIPVRTIFNFVIVAMGIGLFTSLGAAMMCVALNKGGWHVGFHLLALLACSAWGWLLCLSAAIL